MNKHVKLVFSNTDFLTGMYVGQELYADLRLVNLGSLKSTASQLRRSGKGRWEVLQSGKVTRRE